jgi:hypothetical protein
MGMALTTVAELRSTLGVGTLYSDAILQSVADAADAVLLPMLWTNTNFAVSHSSIVGKGTLYFNEQLLDTYYVGQSVAIAGCGSSFNGTKVLTEVTPYSISMVTNHAAVKPIHPIAPFGTVTATNYTDWTTDESIQNAALIISVEIWQARTATLSGSNAVDFQPSPYRMSAQLLAKVRGLVSHALDPRSLIG